MLARHPEIKSLEFGLYTYTPQTVLDERRFVICNATEWLDVADDWPEYLGPREELAFHSRVRVGNDILAHVPLIDFRGELSTDHFRRVVEVAGEFGSNEVQFFRSGRSFHAYLNAVLEPDLWRRFVGRLLLLNAPNEAEWVDTRWLGHGLIAGFSALRWTHNTPTYVQPPTLAARMTLDGMHI